MPKYECSFAYDVPHYVDFVVEAKSKKEAEKIIKAALKAGRFEQVPASACYENQCNERVFVQGRTGEFSTETKMEELEGFTPVP